MAVVAGVCDGAVCEHNTNEDEFRPHPLFKLDFHSISWYWQDFCSIGVWGEWPETLHSCQDDAVIVRRTVIALHWSGAMDAMKKTNGRFLE